MQSAVDILNNTTLKQKTQTTTDNGSNQRTLDKVKAVDNQKINNKAFDISAHDRATSVISGIRNALSNLTNKDIWVTTHERKVKEAMGGINIPRHAAGGFGVATQPTMMPYGQIGEDGWEAVVPLTNRLYVRPFANAVAQEVNAGNNQMLASIDRRLAKLDSNLGRTIAANAPVVVESERDFARRVRGVR